MKPHMVSLLAIGVGSGRGMCPLLPKVEAFGILSIAVVVSIGFRQCVVIQ